MIHQWMTSQMDDAITLLERIRHDDMLIQAMGRVCDAVLECFDAGGKVLAIGNGGSATDALHLSEELIGHYQGHRPPLPAICLSADGPAVTCIGNDYGFEHIFSRQIEALCRPGDIVIVFSTSGNSANIVEALETARQRGVVTIGLLGRDGGKALPLCNLAVVVPHQDTARIQEIHTIVLHFICEAVERRHRTV